MKDSVFGIFIESGFIIYTSHESKFTTGKYTNANLFGMNEMAISWFLCSGFITLVCCALSLHYLHYTCRVLNTEILQTVLFLLFVYLPWMLLMWGLKSLICISVLISWWKQHYTHQIQNSLTPGQESSDSRSKNQLTVQSFSIKLGSCPFWLLCLGLIELFSH